MNKLLAALVLAPATFFLAGCPSNNPAPACTPGQSIACTGAGGCSGGQVCNADGTAYGACNCGAGGDAGSTDAGSTDAGGGGDATMSDASDGGSVEDAGACALRASCTASHDCLGLVDNAGMPAYALRFDQVQFSAPAALTHGIIQNVFSSSFLPNLPSCNVTGAASANWLLRFDTAANTVEVGAARPVTDATQGYTFMNETLSGLAIAPASASLSIASSGGFDGSQPVDVVLPVFLDSAGSSALILPFKQFVLHNGTLSANRNCIGSYNAGGLDPLNSCQGDSTHPTFVNGGSFSAIISLEDADQVVIVSLNESLCVLLSGDAATYGDGGNPAKCKRTNAVINFQGDACTSGAVCHDAVSVSANFAASAVAASNP